MATIDKRETYGAPYEDFHVGDVIKHWPGKTISESDNNLFCAITRNENPLHLDAEYMNGHQHGQLLVVGTLVLSLIVGMTVRDISGQAVANLEYESIRHDGPVFISDTLYAETEVLDKWETSKGNRGIVYVETMGYNQRREKILTVRRRFLCQKRET